MVNSTNNISNQTKIKAQLVFWAFVFLMGVVIYKTISIQFFYEDNTVYLNTENGEKLPTRIVKKKPRRGQILDINHIPLVTSISYYDIYMDPTVIKPKLFNSEISKLSIKLAEIFPEKTAREYEIYIRKARRRGNRYLLIKKNATNIERKQLKTFPIFNKGRFKGGLIDNIEHIIRKRPFGEMARRTLGYVRKIDSKTLKVGIEGAYDEYLRGVDGEEIEQKISTGWKKTGTIIREPEEGATVVTTIDKEIQEVAHKELLNQLKLQEARNGCVVVMEVKTGKIKAISNLFRGNDGNYFESYNQAIGIKEVPGSTFKLASLMALLEDKKVNISDKVNANGRYTFYGKTLHDSKEGGYGNITIQEAFEKSSNVFSKIINDAYKNEPQQFIHRLESFGIVDSLGIELKGEPQPTLHRPGTKGWSGLSLPWMAIGYEVQLTPLQILAFYNAVANNGKFMKPLFVQSIIKDNKVLKEIKPVVLKEKICSDQTLKDLHLCLKGVVKRGTGQALKSAYFDISGKTGTAQILNQDKRYGAPGERKYQASFVGFFPSENPIYSVIVVITAPNKNIYGAKVSGTVFSAIANKVYASRLEFHKPINLKKKTINNLPITKEGNATDFKTITNHLKIPNTINTSDEWVKVNSSGTKLTAKKIRFNKGTVPNVKGMTAKDAIYLLEKEGLVVRITGYGKVVHQSILPGTEIKKGVIINLTLK